MPRPRFFKLEPNIRATILARAAEEFAEHGYEGGSYNRIIERSGLSKGAMYYYFDDKEDLFVTVLQDAVKRLIVDAGNVEAAKNAEDFWREVERWYVRSFRLFQEDPAAMGLLRTLLKNVERGTGSVAMAELRRTGRQYLEAFIASGRRVSAIRDDLPEGLLTSVLMGLEEGIDIWLVDNVAELGDAEMADVAATMTALYRRVAAPEPSPNRSREAEKSFAEEEDPMTLSTPQETAPARPPARTPLPAGPRGIPFLGSTVEMLADPLAFLTRISREYGDVVHFTLPGQEVYLLNHPDAVEEVLKASSDDLRKDDFTQRLSIAVGRGLLTSEGDFWRRQRKLAQPAFHHHRVRAYADTMVGHTERAMARFQDGETRDIHDDMMRLTLDIVAETLFGADVGGAAERIGTALELLMNRMAGYGAILPPWLPTPGNFRIKRAIRDMDEVVYGIIRNRRSGADRGDLLSMLLAATTEEGGSMSDQQLRDEIVTLLLAGHETTALALTFTFHLLAGNPKVYDELSSEVTRTLGQRAATFADLPNLPYADAVVRETLRLYPPAWAIGREAARPCRLAGLDLLPGHQLWLAQWVVHRDARWFPEPAAFKPERWRDDSAKRLPRSAYFPFGGGPRICIGNAFAMMEAVLLLVTIIQRVRLHALQGEPLALAPSVTLRPKGPVRMRIERRA